MSTTTFNPMARRNMHRYKTAAATTRPASSTRNIAVNVQDAVLCPLKISIVNGLGKDIIFHARNGTMIVPCRDIGRKALIVHYEILWQLPTVVRSEWPEQIIKDSELPENVERTLRGEPLHLTYEVPVQGLEGVSVPRVAGMEMFYDVSTDTAFTYRCENDDYRVCWANAWGCYTGLSNRAMMDKRLNLRLSKDVMYGDELVQEVVISVSAYASDDNSFGSPAGDELYLPIADGIRVPIRRCGSGVEGVLVTYSTGNHVGKDRPGTGAKWYTWDEIGSTRRATLPVGWSLSSLAEMMDAKDPVPSVLDQAAIAISDAKTKAEIAEIEGSTRTIARLRQDLVDSEAQKLNLNREEDKHRRDARRDEEHSERMARAVTTAKNNTNILGSIAKVAVPVALGALMYKG